MKLQNVNKNSVRNQYEKKMFFREIFWFGENSPNLESRNPKRHQYLHTDKKNRDFKTGLIRLNHVNCFLKIWIWQTYTYTRSKKGFGVLDFNDLQLCKKNHNHSRIFLFKKNFRCDMKLKRVLSLPD